MINRYDLLDILHYFIWNKLQVIVCIATFGLQTHKKVIIIIILSKVYKIYLFIYLLYNMFGILIL